MTTFNATTYRAPKGQVGFTPAPKDSTRPRLLNWNQYLRWLWLIVFLGSLNFVFRTAYDISMSYLTIGVVHRVVSLAIVAIPVTILMIRQPRKLFIGLPGLLIIFSLWRLLSTAWSALPMWTLYRAVEYMYIVALMAFTVASLSDLEDVQAWLNWVWGWIAAQITSAWVGLLLFPDKALVHWPDALLPVALMGVAPRINPNGLAQLGGILALVGISRWLSAKRSPRWLLLVIPGLTTLLLAQGRAAMIGFLLGFFAILVLYRKIGIIWSLLTALATTTLLGSERTWRYIGHFFTRGQSSAVLWGLAARTRWWELTWRYFIRKNIFLGYGAFAGGRLVAPLTIGISVGEASRIALDNAWLELMADTGIISVILFFLLIVWVFRILISHALHGDDITRLIAIECLGIFILLFVRSFFASSITLHSEFSFFAIVGCAEYLRRNASHHRST